MGRLSHETYTMFSKCAFQLFAVDHELRDADAEAKVIHLIVFFALHVLI